MTTKLVRIGFRMAVLTAICVLGFYIGRPLYWKLTATLQDIREKDYTQEAVKQGLSDLMREAQQSVGWGAGAAAAIKVEHERALKRLENKSADSKKPSTTDVTVSGKANRDGKSRLSRRMLLASQGDHS